MTFVAKLPQIDDLFMTLMDSCNKIQHATTKIKHIYHSGKFLLPWSCKNSSLTLSNMGKGRFTLAYMSHDHLHGSHVGLPMVERVKTSKLANTG